MLPLRAALAVVLMSGVALAGEADPIVAPRPWLGGQKDVKEAVRRFFSKTLKLDENETTLRIAGDRVFVASQIMGGISYEDCHCSTPFKLRGSTFSVSCSMECIEHYSQMRGPMPSKRVADEDFELSVQIDHVADDLMIASDGKQRWVFGVCGVENPFFEAVKCEGLYREKLDSSAWTVQVIPGAKDRTLFSAVKSEAVKMDLEGTVLTIEGAPASKPRVESEVFYVSDATKPKAEKVAAALASVIGKVAVKPWPGQWPYDVVVVVGSQPVK